MKDQARNNLGLLTLLVVIVGLVSEACAAATPAPTLLPPTVGPTSAPTTTATIPLGLNPSKDTLNPGDQVVISVVSEEWQTADLAWTLTSQDPKALPAPGKLSATKGPTVSYIAPDGSGRVKVLVNGTIKGRVGSAAVFFTIQPKPTKRVVTFWTFPPFDTRDKSRVSEFTQLKGYSDVEINITSLSPKDIQTLLSKAIAAGTAPDAVRFPGTSDAKAFGEKGLLDAGSATQIIQGIGIDQFDQKTLYQLVDSRDKTRWLAVPTQSQGALGIMSGATDKGAAGAWVTFVVQKELP